MQKHWRGHKAREEVRALRAGPEGRGRPLEWGSEVKLEQANYNNDHVQAKRKQLGAFEFD